MVISNLITKLVGKDYWENELQLYVTRERERFTLPMHEHDFIEIHYVSEGSGYQFINDESIKVVKGDIFIIPIGTKHVYRPLSQNIKNELIVYNCLFSTAIFESVVQQFSLPTETNQLIQPIKEKSYYKYSDELFRFNDLMQAMHYEYSMKQMGYEAMLYALLAQMLVYLYRSEKRNHVQDATKLQLRHVLNYIEQHSHTALTLAELSQLIPTSESYMQRLIKKTTGQNFKEYLQNVRIKKGITLLIESNDSTKQIAEKIGYKDMKYFHALFRRKTGMTPKMYKKQYILVKKD